MNIFNQDIIDFSIRKGILLRWIPGFEGKYAINCDGTKCWSERSSKFLKPWVQKGRMGYILSKKCRPGQWTASVLVIRAWKGLPSKDLVVKAKAISKLGVMVRHTPDPNTLNDHYTNLEYGTHHDNVDDMLKAGRQSRGERQAKAKHTEKEIAYIKFLLLTKSALEISKEFDYSYDLVRKLAKNFIWKHVKAADKI